LRTLKASDPAATAALLSALDDPEQHVREAAATALSFIDAGKYAQALPVLDAALDQDALYGPGHPLMQALVKHGAAAVPILVRRTARRGAPRSNALSILPMFPVGTPGVANALKALAATGEADARHAAMLAVASGHLTAADAAVGVASGMGSADRDVRLSAMMSAVAAAPGPDAARQLQDIAGDRDDPLRPFAIVGLAWHDAAFARTHVDDLVRLLTIDAWTEAFRGTGIGSVSGDFAARPATVLGRLGPDAAAALPALRALAADRQPQTAAAARIAVARIEGRGVAELVDAAVADLTRDQRSRADGLMTLMTLGPEAAAALPALERFPASGRPGDVTDWMVQAAIAAIRGEAPPSYRREPR
jgi:hypothetical protein